MTCCGLGNSIGLGTWRVICFYGSRRWVEGFLTGEYCGGRVTSEGVNVGLSLGSGEVVALVSLQLWKRQRRWSIARSCCLLLTAVA